MIKGKNAILITFILLLLFSFSTQKLVITNLDSWSFNIQNADKWYPAKIPSSFAEDLIDNGLVTKNPYFRDNFLQFYQYQTKNVVYKATFSVPASLLQTNVMNTILFKGLDTHCDVYLNSELILTSHNMYVQNRIGVNLKPQNTIEVRFNSSAIYDQQMDQKFYEQRQWHLPQNFSFTRKAAYQYGWDWGPRILTVGIWKPVYIQSIVNLGKIENFTFFNQGIPASKSQPIVVKIGFDILHNYPSKQLLNLSGTIEIKKDSKTIANSTLKIDLPIQRITSNILIQGPTDNLIWWTWDMGYPNLLDVEITLVDSKNKQNYTFHQVTGIRQVKVVQQTVDNKTSFTFKLNGKQMFMRGGNYIPPQMSIARINQSRYKGIIQDALFANFNMLRVWGGGQYQHDAFYQECDKAGILIWHDLMFACAMYIPQFLQNARIDAQIQQNIRRLSVHPSIGLWNGNNQVWIGWNQWGWKRNLTSSQISFAQGQYFALFRDIIPKAIEKAGSDIYYWQTSPSAGSSSLDTIGSGDIHFWRVWALGTPIQQYTQYVGRFNSQYGMQSYPEMSTIQKFTYYPDRNPTNIIMRLHERHPKGDIYLPQYTKNYSGTSKQLETLVYFSQVMQAYALQIAIGALRGNKPFCMGSLYWQLNDVWPCSTWSTVDYYSNYKASHYTARRMYTPLLAYVLKNVKQQTYQIFVNNDYPRQLNVTVNITVMQFNGNRVLSNIVVAKIAALQNQIVKILKIEESYQDNAFISINIKSNQNHNQITNYFFTKPSARKILNPQLSFKILSTESGNFVEITNKNLATYVWMYLKPSQLYSPWKRQDNYFTLLPGSITRIPIQINIKLEDIAITCYQIEKIKSQQSNQIAQLNMEKSLRAQ